MKIRKTVAAGFTAVACLAIAASPSRTVRAEHEPPGTPWRSAAAEPLSGPYFAASFAPGTAPDMQTTAGFEAEYEFEVGGEVGVGYAAGPVRVETMLMMQQYDLFDIEPDPVSGLAPVEYGGEIVLTGAMANAYIDFNLSPRLRPYIGAGGGVGFASVTYGESECDPGCMPDTNLVDDGDGVNLWQIMVGVTISQANRSRGDIYMGYRYLRSTDMTLHLADGTPFRHEGVEAHILELGVRLGGP